MGVRLASGWFGWWIDGGVYDPVNKFSVVVVKLGEDMAEVF